MSGMRLASVSAWVITTSLAVSATAHAQPRVSAGSAAAGGDIGVYSGIQDYLGSGLTLEGFYEYYFDPRVSMRFGLGWAEPEFENDEDAVKIVRIPFDILYNWNGGDVRPFVGAGIGAYILTLKDNGRTVRDSESTLGATLFGGVEFSASRSTALKAELRYHIIDDIRGVEPDGFSLTIGLKKYF